MLFVFGYVTIKLSVRTIGVVKREVTALMILALRIIHFIVAIGLIAGVLLQSGKSAGLSGVIDGGASVIFGKKSRAIDKLLSKLTTVAAIIFMITSLALAIL